MAALLAPFSASAQQPNNYFLTATYRAVLGRYPDPQGWYWWSGQLSSLTPTQLTGFFLDPNG